jgi:Concanavalin A-like lectin/glucanases superfamily
MPRIIPDLNDQIVWTLSESSGNYHNTGQFLPQNINTDLVITNTIPQNGTGIFYTNCPQIPGTSNFPTGTSATRNYASGASLFNPTAPLTVSCWVQLRSYTTNNNMGIIAKEYRNPSLNGNVWSAPFYALSLNILTSDSGGDWTCGIALNSSTSAGFTVTDFPIPLGQWSHVGMTYDGALIRVYLNGCQMISSGNPTINTVAAASISYTDGTNGFGAWKVGAIINTGSGSKEEINGQIQDVRIANVARPLAYFQKVYAAGALPQLAGHFAGTQYFKLRAYDTACSTATPVVWVDTQVSLANAPAFPCGGPYTAPEVIDTWFQ